MPPKAKGKPDPKAKGKPDPKAKGKLDPKGKKGDKDVPKKKIPPPPACFNAEDLARFKEIYKEFDEDNIDLVAIKHLPLMLRKLGFNPKGAEIQQLYKMFLEDEFVDTMEFHEFLFMLEAKVGWGDDVEAEIIKAFAFLGHDKEDFPTGEVNMEVLKEELFNWGEPLEEAEFVDMPKVALKEKVMNFESYMLDYTKFVDKMNAKDVKFLKEPINFWKLDQATLAAMAIQKALEEKAEIEKREEERRQREEAKRQRMIEQGLILEDD